MRQQKLKLLLPVVLGLILGFTGVSFAAHHAGAYAEARLAQRGAAHSDAWLSKQVRHQLLMLPYYGVFDNLEYRVNGYNVELFGQVVDPTLKSDAEGVVKHIEGVGQVTNHIEVLPVSFFDDRIRFATLRAIYGEPALQRYALGANPPIHIIVKNGNVVLVGVVDSEMDKQLAYMQADSVPGVFSVKNELRID